MEKIDTTPVDRSSWPPGPWDNEPEDRVEFDHAGLPCLMVRNINGFWCGYVAVPPGHKLWHVEYNDVNVDVHGGLSYSDVCDGRICHIARPGEPSDVWWFGFDCGNYDDTDPIREQLRAYGGTYKDIAFVRAHTTHLAEQLAQMS